MSRISTSPDAADKPRIDRGEVVSFFEQRAEKIATVGPVRAVIYQDKHPDLAERRDAAEKARIAPLLELDGSQSLLDLGCGTGRWAAEIAASCARYHGIDVSEGLVAYAREQFRDRPSCRFTVSSVDDFSLASIGETAPFDRVLGAGVLIYLNDDEVQRTFNCLEPTLSPRARAVFREPMGIGARLTVQDHFSTDLDQTYNAIYRTEEEIELLMKPALIDRGFRIVGAGNVFEDDSLNNRAETRQRWLVLERN